MFEKILHKPLTLLTEHIRTPSTTTLVDNFSTTVPIIQDPSKLSELYATYNKLRENSLTLDKCAFNVEKIFITLEQHKPLGKLGIEHPVSVSVNNTEVALFLGYRDRVIKAKDGLAYHVFGKEIDSPNNTFKKLAEFCHKTGDGILFDIQHGDLLCKLQNWERSVKDQLNPPPVQSPLLTATFSGQELQPSSHSKYISNTSHINSTLKEKVIASSKLLVLSSFTGYLGYKFGSEVGAFLGGVLGMRMAIAADASALVGRVRLTNLLVT